MPVPNSDLFRSYTQQLRKGIGPSGVVAWADRIYMNTQLSNNAEAICDLIDAATAIEDCLDSFTPEAPTAAMWKAHKLAVDAFRGK